ncbi:hypothetical protein RQP46_004616 [Phenoliferia psychrophenolica]
MSSPAVGKDLEKAKSTPDASVRDADGGLFVGVGSAVSSGGPLGVLLGYTIMGLVVYSMMITIPAEISAAALVIDYWPGGQNVNVAVWITVFFIVICAFNFIGVRSGSQFQQLKGIPGSLGRFLSFWTVFVQAAFSFLGTEIVALTAGEAENPQRTVPKAIKKVFYRITIFYVGGVFVIGLLVSPNNDQLLNGSGVSASPWVIAIEEAGIRALPSIINVVVLISAFSAGNSDLYAASRTLYGLACDRKAPAIFRRCTKGGLPIFALIATALFGFLACGNSSNQVFTWLSDLSSITGLIAWQCILLSYIRFYHGMKRQGISRDTLPYIAPFQPWASYVGLIFVTLVVIFNGYTVFLANSWSTADFIVDYISLPLFALLFVFWKLYKKTKLVSLDEMDFHTGLRELELISERDEANYVAPTTFWAKVWDAVM